MDDATVADVRDIDGPVRCGNTVVGGVEVTRAYADPVWLPRYPMNSMGGDINSDDRLTLFGVGDNGA